MNTDGFGWDEDVPVDLVREGGSWERDALVRLTERIIGCAYTISNALGVGFLEKVYENALAHELRKTGLVVAQQQPLKVWYDGVIVGDYVADLVVQNQVLVELKVARVLDDAHLAQCLNYLRATNLRCCLLMNFGEPRVRVRRLLNRY